MIKIIRKWIGKLTLPDNVYVCSLGDYWIEFPFIPNYHNLKLSGYVYRDYSNTYNYRQIKQNYWGVWEEVDSYLGLNSPLPESWRKS